MQFALFLGYLYVLSYTRVKYFSNSNIAKLKDGNKLVKRRTCSEIKAFVVYRRLL